MPGRHIDRWLALVPALVIGSLLVWARCTSQGIAEAGDGVQHHMIARYCWKHPALLLDQWGKPMFALLASPFAQFGYNAMAVFNASLAVLAAVLAVAPLRRAGSWTVAAFPVVLMLAPHYAHLVIDGMTEILFGTVALLVVRLLLEERYRAAAIVASLTPLCRPEYVVFLPAVMCWLAWKKRFAVIPWCAMGIIAYTVFGIASTGDPLCWWNGDPYGSGPSIYGKGDPWRFLLDAPRAFGWPLVVVFLLALSLWPWVFRKDAEAGATHALLLWTAALPALGIVAVHAYLRWSGTHGSAGFTRVLVTASPLAALFGLHTLGRGILLLTRSSLPGPIIGVVLACIGVTGLSAEGPLRHDPDDEQVVINQACDRIAETRHVGDRVFTTHPYVPFRVGLDGFDDEESRMLWGFHEDMDKGPSRSGDIIFWEPAFGPNECGVELGTILDNPAFTVLGVYVPKHGHIVFGGRPYETWVFQRYPAKRSTTHDTIGAPGALADIHVRLDTMPCAEGAGWCSDREFPMTIEKLPLPKPGSLYEDWVVEMDIRYLAEGSEAAMVFKRTIGEELFHYDDRPIHEGMNRISFRAPTDTVRTEQSLYIYSPEKRALRCASVRVVRDRVWQERSPKLSR